MAAALSELSVNVNASFVAIATFPNSSIDLQINLQWNLKTIYVLCYLLTLHQLRISICLYIVLSTSKIMRGLQNKENRKFCCNCCVCEIQQH